MIKNYRKQVQNVDGKDRIIRSCGIEDSQKDCYTTLSSQVKTFVCQCKTDGCNHGARVNIDLINFIIPIFTVYIIFKCSLLPNSFV